MRRRLALCVGNNYPRTSAALRGCVNDAWDWSELLSREGYDVHVLVEATKGEVVAKLRELVARAGWGDRIVFTFSGHGTWIVDRNGDEEDGRDEALVMSDFAEGGLLTDDEIQGIFRHLKRGAHALFLPDSCHSGTVTRLYHQDAIGIPKFMPPCEYSEDAVRAIEAVVPVAPAEPTASSISGSGDLEFSYDAVFGTGVGRPNGAFTRIAIDVFRPGMSLGQWHRAIREVLPLPSYPQTPQLTVAKPYRKYVAAF